LKNIKHIFILFAITLLPVVVSSQTNTTDEQLALQFYQNKEYDKALDYYEKLYYKVSPQLFYKSYLNCLLQTKNFNKAEKLVKKQLKKFPQKLDYMVDLGMVYARAEELKKAAGTWEEAIDAIKYDDQVFIVANAFIELHQYDYAVKTYLKGRKISENNYPFSFELADVYKTKGDKTAMINEYLNVLETQDAYIQAVQNALQSTFGNDADHEQNNLLKTELLKRIQRSPDKTIFSELLIWMQLQQKDVEGAFLQAKALDKRKKEEGDRIMALAQLFVQNQNYGIAVRAYQYVIDKGNKGKNYTDARLQLLDVNYQKVITQNNYTNAELVKLDSAYRATISEFGKSPSTAPLFKNLAHLDAFYLHKTKDAVGLLEQIINQHILDSHTQAEFKLELGDILLLSGDIWEASLRYSQVEKTFKYDEIGQDAKFRNAKISYYTNDFKWAQAQLDVLKGATSKLISNDAMDLSLLISDALAIDSSEAPLILFAHADLLVFQNKDDEAITTLDSIKMHYPNHSLSDDVLFRKAQIAVKHDKYNDAATFYESIINDYGYDIIADDALFKLAELNENQFKNTEKAKELYQQLIEKYPGSLYVVEARKRFRNLRGDAVN
jgi:tetratricopeptide (TPR) repeat protein